MSPDPYCAVMTKPCSNAPAASFPHRVTGAYVQPLLDAAAARGVGGADLARAAGLAPDSLARLPESLPAPDYIRLLDAGAALAADPHFGLHVGEQVRLGAYSVYGMILLACRDFGQALEQTQRYEQLAHDLGRSRVAVQGGRASYAWTSHYPRASRHLAESVFAGIRVIGNWLAGGALPPATISFMHGTDAPHGEYERVLGCVPDFGAAAHSASFDAALLAMPVPNADVAMYPVLVEHAERLLAQRGARDATVEQVRAAMVRRLAHEPVRLGGVARELGVGSRTLQRKLAEAGVSFQQLLDQTRYALARDYLRRRELSLVDIAFLLGYQEQSAFTHAFREWSGTNPGAWRDSGVSA